MILQRKYCATKYRFAYQESEYLINNRVYYKCD